ncbi:hypothetical protein KR026_011726, partial [Drosophila bipectinata]
QRSVKLLGFVVTSEGTTTDPEKVRAIKEFPEPKNVFKVRSIMGLAGYYREVNYATNQRELLAIVWVLENLRHYLYGVKDLNIYTDHQPLTYAVSDSNPNTKIKRWKERIDECGAKVHYMPGKAILVADALSRQQLNDSALEKGPFSSAATIHSELSLTHTIHSTDKPLNCFQNQIILEEARSPSKRSFVLFRNKRRHIIDFTCE